MQIKGKRVLVLGGWGLVGMAICRKLTEHEPACLIVTSLRQSESEEAVESLRKEYPHLNRETFHPSWGNIFLRTRWKDANFDDVLSDVDNRRGIIEDIYNELDSKILDNSALYSLLIETMPDIVIDCINTATAIAYKDIYSGVNGVTDELLKGNLTSSSVEKLMANLYIPQLIRHVQIFYRGLLDSKSSMYVKIGTSGTGGMGLNIPYTHSEERPSRVLLAKAAIGGAQSLLLFLMARTPDGPIVKEIKPTAAIAWKKIGYGPVRRGGKPIPLVDMKPHKAKTAEGMFRFDDTEGITDLGDEFKSAFIDTGENGIFSRGEFEAISSLGQMEMVTPEEIADSAVFEILGGNSGHDIVAGLDAFTLGPSYRGGMLRNKALEHIKLIEAQHGEESIAFELLGPPRLSKLLYEANLLKRSVGSIEKVIETKPHILAEMAVSIIEKDEKYRSQMLSIGLVVLMPDGKSYLRGKLVKIPVQRVETELEITKENINAWANEGWVDLRPENFERWQTLLKKIISQASSLSSDDTSSRNVYTTEYWNKFSTIDEGKIVGWIFEYEDKGWRFKR
ncbi:MAG: hypothetical protein HW421_1034 [Ignavibacteria bacterium]|nr:hypothetical protein [Ignavibacteria bacterium]